MYCWEEMPQLAPWRWSELSQALPWEVRCPHQRLHSVEAKAMNSKAGQTAFKSQL